MKRYVRIVAVCALVSLALASCKVPCGCNGHGYGKIIETNSQVEQRA